MEAKLTKAQIQESARAKAIEASGVDVTDMYQTDTGAFVMKIDDQYVELKFIVKGDKFDLADAMEAFKEKKAKAAERAAEKEAKAAAREAKEKAKAEKAE